jgi:hypothetical protein
MKTKNHHALHIIVHSINVFLETLSLPDNSWVSVEQGDQEHRQVSDSITFQSQGKFILLISLDCTGFETSCKVMTSHSNISKEAGKPIFISNMISGYRPMVIT